MIKYRLNAISKTREVWTSQCTFEAETISLVGRAILAGWLIGTYYWATDEQGYFLCGCDPEGKALKGIAQ